MSITDSYKQQGQRKKLIELLRQKGIKNPEVLAAIGSVPRHVFFTSEFLHFAYEDQAFPIAEGQTISQPYTVAMQTELLQISAGQRVLEIGTGSGYQCAVLCCFTTQVYSIEYHLKLHRFASKMLTAIGCKPHLFHGDGGAGLPAHAPFDRMLFTCGTPEVPQAVLSQLAVGGVLVAPLGSDYENLEMTRLTRVSDSRFELEKHGKFRFVPLLGRN